MASGCGSGKKQAADDPYSWSTNNLKEATVLTNNTYVAGRGFYHAPYFGFFPYSYNSHLPGRGYYHGGSFSPEPPQSTLTASPPGRMHHAMKQAREAETQRGGFTRGRGSSGRSWGFSGS